MEWAFKIIPAEKQTKDKIHNRKGHATTVGVGRLDPSGILHDLTDFGALRLGRFGAEPVSQRREYRHHSRDAPDDPHPGVRKELR